MGKDIPILDVRSPGEFKHAHIPGAFNLPLFTDEERRLVGTTYKQQSREAAIRIGLDFFGPKMRSMVEQVESLVEKTSSKQLLLHCWRGGMRSEAVAWLLDLYGFRVYTLTGGYKAYRHWIIESFSLPFRLQVLGGYSGSGKTKVLGELQRRGECIIDLEDLAHHKGSAFGNIGMPAQPGQEMFENKLGHALREILNNRPDVFEPTIWVEDESQRIGPVNIPAVFWQRMLHSSLFFVELPFETRLQRIVEEYGHLDRDRIANAITRIRKRLGGLETKRALAYLQEDDIISCFQILLTYYDKSYRKSLEKNKTKVMPFTHLSCDRADPRMMAAMLTNKETFSR